MPERSFRGAGHLPNLRPDRQPGPPDDLPRQRRGTTPQMIGRYPDYDILENADEWDEVTRKVVLDRANNPPPLRFFTGEEARTLGAFCDELTAQNKEPRIPVLNMVDAKLYEGRLDGYRYEDMPEDPQTWRLVAQGLDEAARGSFADLNPQERHHITARFAEGNLTGGVWEQQLNCSRAWSVVTRQILSAFYSHPWAWNEIGYGGPRYPRGYMRLGVGRREPDQAAEAFAMDPVQDVARRGDQGAPL